MLRSLSVRRILLPLAWLALASLFLPLRLPAQATAAQPSSQRGPRIVLEEQKTLPGGSVMMPLSFIPDPGAPLSAFSLDIAYVSNSLAFDKTMLGLAAEMANAKVEARLTERPADEQGLKRAALRVSVSLPDPASKEGLPEGLLAYLVFEVSQNAKPFKITLTPTVLSAEDVSAPPKKVAGVSAASGFVIVQDPEAVFQSLSPELAPDVTCFFFTH
jgi:hypothetical protein